MCVSKLYFISYTIIKALLYIFCLISFILYNLLANVLLYNSLRYISDKINNSAKNDF